jgi:hypothetical protein
MAHGPAPSSLINLFARRMAISFLSRSGRTSGRSRKISLLPSCLRRKPTTIEITERGAQLLLVSATVGAASIISTPARAG